MRLFRANSNPPELAGSTTTTVHASAECMLYEDTDSTILLRRTQTQRCSHVTHHGLGSRSMREEAFSMEGYHNASLALHRMHQDFSGLPLLSRAQPWQQAARNSPNASTIWWHASTFQTVATSSAKFSERIHVRHVRHAPDSDVDVCSPSCRGNFNKTTSCTWPRTSSTCATTSS